MEDLDGFILGAGGGDGGGGGASVEDSAQILIAKALLRDGRHDSAKRVLRLVLAQSPDCVEALFTLGFVHDVGHENDGVAQAMSRVVELDPEHAHAWLFKGMSESRRGDYKEAIRSFLQAFLLDPTGAAGSQASVSLELLRRNMGCPLVPEPRWADAAPRIAAQAPRQGPEDLDEAARPSPRPLFRRGGWVRVWDGILGPRLLERVRESVDDLCTWGVRNPGGCSTYWLGRGDAPRTAAEVAGRILLETVLGLRAEDFVGIEWWCKNQSASLGAHFHYDTALADGGLHRPEYSSVLYLSDEGGPTVVLDQAADAAMERWPEVPQEGHVVAPRANRWMVFPGELRHGMVPVDGSREPRRVVLYNFWRRHRPGPPSCQVPDFSSYEPVSAHSVASRHYLPRASLARLDEEERLRPFDGQTGCRREVPVEEVSRPEELGCGSTFGDLPFAMPMPCAARLQRGPLEAAALYLPWRRLAAEWLGGDPTRAGGAVPLDMAARLALREQPGGSAGPTPGGESSARDAALWSMAKR